MITVVQFCQPIYCKPNGALTKKIMTEVMSMVKLSSKEFRVFIMTEEKNRK